jgi:hypothetical protein
MLVDQTLDLAEGKPVTEFAKDAFVAAGRAGLETTVAVVSPGIIITKVIAPVTGVAKTVVSKITPTVIQEAAQTAGQFVNRTAITPAREFVSTLFTRASEALAKRAAQQAQQQTAKKIAQALAKDIRWNEILGLNSTITDAEARSRIKQLFMSKLEQELPGLSEQELGRLIGDTWEPIKRELDSRSRRLALIAREAAEQAAQEAQRVAQNKAAQEAQRAAEKAAQETAQRAAQQAEKEAALEAGRQFMTKWERAAPYVKNFTIELARQQRMSYERANDFISIADRTAQQLVQGENKEIVLKEFNSLFSTLVENNPDVNKTAVYNYLKQKVDELVRVMQ